MSQLQFCDVAKAKQAKKQSLIPKDWLVPKELLLHAKEVLSLPGKVLTPQELEITNSSVAVLLQHLHSLQEHERWTSVEVTTAFCKRASVAEQATNCLTEIFFDEALEQAREVDAYFEKNGRPIGSLAGLPVSVKDCFNVVGQDSTLGFVTWANEPAEYDSLLVKLLRKAGAILYCKTNVPTAMMIAESVNNVFGRTLNPHHLDFTCGGSSGGEAALIAMRGSPLGVGTDIGGSIRIPGALCGLYTLKPSFGRFPTMGCRSGMSGQEAVNSINGPMANDLASLGIFAKAIVDLEPWRFDPKCIPIPWKNIEPSSLPSKGLVFGMIFDDGCVHPTPPVVRALLETKKVLERQGHSVIEWKLQDEELKKGAAILQAFFAMEGRHGIHNLMKAGNEHEKWVPGLGPVVEPKTVSESWAKQAERWNWSAKICERWESMKGPDGRVMDAIISPVTPHAGAEHDRYGRHVGFTGIWNIMDMPSITLPICKADKHLDGKETHQPPQYHSSDDEFVWQNYNADRVHGLPTGLQIVGRRLEEEKVLALAEIVSALLLISR
ncbi:hypothetical protein CBS101457_002645 [Exobasidium rhododendri]|nr:hypothetical protein CBS101457_002645 [Exobasidium rhododendri]